MSEAVEDDPLRVVIVEDEALLAMEVEAIVEASGHRVVGWAASASDAIDLITRSDVDLALVDLQLMGGSSGLTVSRRFANLPPLIVFLTANPGRIPEDFAGAAGVIEKPYRSVGLVRCLSYLSQGIRRPPPVLSKPMEFNIAPAYKALWGNSAQI